MYVSSVEDEANQITEDVIPFEADGETLFGSSNANLPVLGSDRLTKKTAARSTGPPQTGAVAFVSVTHPRSDQEVNGLTQSARLQRATPRSTGHVPKAVMFLVVLSACIMSAIQAWHCIQRYQQEPVLVKRSSRQTALLSMPAFTLCNPAMDEMSVRAYGGEFSGLPWAEEGNRTMTKFIRDVLPRFDGFLSCQLLNEPCDQLGSWQNRYTSGLGVCTTFLPFSNLTVNEVGAGYELTYYHNKGYYSTTAYAVQVGDKFLSYKQKDRRLYVFLHDIREPFTPLPWVRRLTPLQVPTGAIANVKIISSFQRRQNRRFSVCHSGETGVDDDRDGDDDEDDGEGEDGGDVDSDEGANGISEDADVGSGGDGHYSQVRCLERCLSRATLTSANASCRTIDMMSAAPVCDTAAEYIRLLLLYNDIAAPAVSEQAACHRRCPPACRSIQYQPEVNLYRAYSVARQDSCTLTKLRLVYDSLEIGVEEEVWAYTVSAMLGEIGGFIGIMLGVSVVSLFQALKDVLSRADGWLCR